MKMINTFVALDIETTGLNPAEDKIIEIGMAKVENGIITDGYQTLVDPAAELPYRITELTGITQSMLEGKPLISDIICDIMEFIGDLPLLGHNIIFDYSFLKKAAVNNGLKFEKSGIDTLKLARRLLPEVKTKKLSFLCEHFAIEPGNSHRAYDDAVSAIRLYEKLYEIKPEDEGFNELITLNYSAKKDSPITPAQRKYLMALLGKHNLKLSAFTGCNATGTCKEESAADNGVESLYTELDRLTKSKASKIIDSIISEYGK